MTQRMAYALIAVMIVVQGWALHLMGHVTICACGEVKLWHGDVFSSENSQHLTDWYTFGHVNHGLLFYALFQWTLARLSLDWRLVLTGLSGLIWEVGENTDMVINRFREVTISLDYYGDSVVNSMTDTVFMTAGFALARVIPGWLTATLFVGFEVFTTAVVRDGLALNTLMLLWPIDAVRDWQMAGWTAP
jgi:hypothetical protein